MTRSSGHSLSISTVLVATVALGAVASIPVVTAPADSAIGIVFRVSTWNETAMDWELRWIGTPGGPILSGPEISPEDTDRPFVGFARRFRIEWEATSPGGAITGYRYEASQDPAAGFQPPDQNGQPQFDTTTAFVFENAVPVEQITPGQCPSGWPDCPEELRFASGQYLLAVQARDATGAVSAPIAGELVFDVNYPPVTELRTDAGFPAYWDGAAWVSVADGDTVPEHAYLIVQASGLDRLEQNRGDLPPGLSCCDERLDPEAPEVRLQARVSELVGVDAGSGREVRHAGLFGLPDVSDTVGIVAGPFVTTMSLRMVDEHGRRDPDPVEFHFVGGFAPRLIGVEPADGSRLLARLPGQAPWPQNEIAYAFSPVLTRYWDPATRTFEETDAAGRIAFSGHELRYALRALGSADPREEQTGVRSFSFALVSEFDPLDLRTELPGESPDLSFFMPAASPDLFDTGLEEDAPSIFVPILLWFSPELFDQAGGPENPLVQVGTAVARQLGVWTFRVRGRTTSAGDVYPVYPGVRPDPSGPVLDVDVGDLGRATGVAEHDYTIELGLDPTSTGTVTQVWPPESFDLFAPQLLSAQTVAFDEVLLTFDEEVSADSVGDPAHFRVYVTAMPSDRPTIVFAERVGATQCRLRFDEPLRSGRAYTLAYRDVTDPFGNLFEDWVLADLDTAVDVPDPARKGTGPVIHRSRPNPFNPRTTLDYHLPRGGDVRLELFDVAGRRVRVLVDGFRSAGPRQVSWDGTDDRGRAVASGIYLARLRAQDGVDTHRLVLVR